MNSIFKKKKKKKEMLRGEMMKSLLWHTKEWRLTCKQWRDTDGLYADYGKSGTNFRSKF